MTDLIQPRAYTIQEILDYMDCPLCHHLKYVEQRAPAQAYLVDNPNVYYQEAVQETIRYYFTLHQQGKPPALKTLYDKYYTLWLEKTGMEDNASILTRPMDQATKHEREKRSKYITQGYESLRAFYELQSRTPQAVLGVHHPYTIQLDGFTVNGHIDLIREVEGQNGSERNIDIVSFQLSKRKPDTAAIQTNLQLIAMSLAFEQMFDIKPDAFLLHYINRSELIPFLPDNSQYKRLLAVLDGFRQSIGRIPPYPRPGAHRYGSPYKELCDTYYI